MNLYEAVEYVDRHETPVVSGPYALGRYDGVGYRATLTLASDDTFGKCQPEFFTWSKYTANASFSGLTENPRDWKPLPSKYLFDAMQTRRFGWGYRMIEELVARSDEQDWDYYRNEKFQNVTLEILSPLLRKSRVLVQASGLRNRCKFGVMLSLMEHPSYLLPPTEINHSRLHMADEMKARDFVLQHPIHAYWKDQLGHLYQVRDGITENRELVIESGRNSNFHELKLHTRDFETSVSNVIHQHRKGGDGDEFEPGHDLSRAT